MGAIELADGTRIAVVGAGPSGCAFASALLASARAFGRRVELVLYDGGTSRTVGSPVLLDVDARYRLASLGAPVPLRQGAMEARGLLLTSGGRSALLEIPPGGLWIVDGVAGEHGRRTVKQALLTAASLRGAYVRPWHVDAAVHVGQRWVVRAQGSSETYDLVVGAFGPSSCLAASWLDGRFRPPPRARGAHARLGGGPRDELIRVYLAPTEEIDLLAVVPSPARDPYVLAAGDDVDPSCLARALALLVRDGALPGPLEIRQMERVGLTAGATRTFALGTGLVLGTAAAGGALDPGLLPTLVGAMRGANAVLEGGACPSLEGRLARSQAEIARHARGQRKTLAWSRRAGPRAPDALARAASEGRVVPPGTLPLMTLPSLDVDAALSAMRRQAIRRMLSEMLVRSPMPDLVEPSPSSLVYVVDDDPDTRSALIDFLQSRGTQVRAFADEMALLDAAARERPVAILLDVVLRWIDGFSLCRALRNHPATARSRLISMSGLNRRSDRDAALAAGADAFLPKPVDLNELDRLLAEVLLPPRQRAGIARAESG